MKLPKWSRLMAGMLCAVLLLGSGSLYRASAAPRDRHADESAWGYATISLRRSGDIPAFTDCDLLYYVERADQSGLAGYTIYRSVDESGKLLPQVMFSDADDPVGTVALSPGAPVSLLYVEQGSVETGTVEGSANDILPGRVISLWGAYRQDDGVFVADRVVVWRIRGTVVIPEEVQD